MNSRVLLHCRPGLDETETKKVESSMSDEDHLHVEYELFASLGAGRQDIFSPSIFTWLQLLVNLTGEQAHKPPRP
jgi:hypothetical protein